MNPPNRPEPPGSLRERAASGRPGRSRARPGDPLETLGRPRRGTLEALDRLGIRTVGELVAHFPRRHEDRTPLGPDTPPEPGRVQALEGLLVRSALRRLRGGRTRVEATVELPTGKLRLEWFNQPYRLDELQAGSRIHLHGKVVEKGRTLWMTSPEYELEPVREGEGTEPARSQPGVHTRRIVPIYPATEGVSPRTLREWIHRALVAIDPDCWSGSPGDCLRTGGPTLAEAVREVHFPRDQESLERALERLRYEEFFPLAIGLHRRREKFRSRPAPSLAVSAELDAKIRSLFPFELTGDQDRAIEEIREDLERPGAMYRLLQGDVGTGKTVVAAYALLAAVRHGHQGALLVPTEVLALQHHETLAGWLRGHPAVQLRLLTGSTPASDRARILEELASGRAHLVVGTQSLIQPGVEFARLGVAIIDEQHRFGIRQRAALPSRAPGVHVLVMTATPIPRSLSTTAFGDLDLSVLERRPAGRQPVKTFLVSPERRSRALDYVHEELERGHQAFFVVPSIDGGEGVSVGEAAEELEARLAPHAVGTLHGRMPPAAKREALEAFRSGQTRALVSTSVIEVGIDVPGATVLFIEDGTRFGLAQLHQLRGRLGRGDLPGICLVGHPADAGPEALERLEIFRSTNDGFQIARADLEARGPGEFLGVDQSGWPDFRFGQPQEHAEEFRRVREDVARLLSGEAPGGVRRGAMPGFPEAENPPGEPAGGSF